MKVLELEVERKKELATFDFVLSTVVAAWKFNR